MRRQYKKLWVLGMVILFWVANCGKEAPPIWTRTYGGINFDASYSVQKTSDHGFIVAGFTYSFGAGDEDVYLIKTDRNGDLLWTKTYGGDDIDEGYSVQETSDRGYIVAGYTKSFGAGQSDVYLIKTDASGDTLWTKVYGGTSYDEAYSVQETSDGGYIVAGYTFSSGRACEDVYLMKIDTSGDILWTRTYGGRKRDYGRSVQPTSDGGYIITGYTLTAYATDEDVYLVKTDASGNTLWISKYGGRKTDVSYSVQEAPDGGGIIAGWTTSFGAGSADIYLIKIKPKSIVEGENKETP